MTEADVIQPSASIASTGKGIRYIGKDHCYAFSGAVSATNAYATILEFTTGSGFILAQFQCEIAHDYTGDNQSFRFHFNDVIVQHYVVTGAVPNGFGASTPVIFLIPPFTKVLVDGRNESSADPYDRFVTLTGRVYGAT
jgi:hypothetical protein